MALNRETIEAFFRGKELPAEVLAEIERAIDDPNSLVSRMSAQYAEVTRLMFDPDGPTFGPTAAEFAEWKAASSPVREESSPEQARTDDLSGSTDVGGASSGPAKRPIRPTLQTHDYLSLPYIDLLGQLPLFIPAAVHADLLAPYRAALRRIVCEEWNWPAQRDNPDYRDSARLADALAEAIARHAAEFPFPPALLAAILVREGLDDFCNLEDRDE